MKTSNNIFCKLKAYGLLSTLYALIILLICFFVSVYVYITSKGNIVAKELALAFTTSLLATTFCIGVGLYVDYVSCKNHKMLVGLHEFGIKDLHLSRQELLKQSISDCRYELWISGYRLVLISGLCQEILEATRRNVKIKLLISPPWEDGFKAVFGPGEKVMDNYCRVFRAMLQKRNNCEVRFTKLPLFNDTYQIDDALVSGPYMHIKDENDEYITANKFFTYVITRKTPLYDLIINENNSLWESAESVLNWQVFEDIYNQIWNGDFKEMEKINMLKSACNSIKDDIRSAS